MPKGIPASGFRKPGAGRKQRETGPTTTIAFRVPITHEARIKMMVKNYLKEINVKA